MTKYCCAPGCLNVWNQNKNITFHRFPHKRPDILEKWINATKMKNFEANFFAMICSDHFTTDCYTENNLHRRILKREAIPTIFKVLNDKMKSVDKIDIENVEVEASSSTESQGEMKIEESETNGDSTASDSREVENKTDLFTLENSMLKIKGVIDSEECEGSSLKVLDVLGRGKVFVWGKDVYYSESDGFVTNEMVSFLPLCSHPNPENVLVVRCGHGGVAKTTSKHPVVKKIVQLENHQSIIDFSNKHFPVLATGLDPSKVNLEICDADEYLKNHKGEFDVIIALHGKLTDSYLSLLKEALRSDGIISVRFGGMWEDGEKIKNTANLLGKFFEEIRYASLSVPTFDQGQMGVFLASTNGQTDFTKPKLVLTKEDVEKHELQFYNSEIHSACFTLPNFALKKLLN